MSALIETWIGKFGVNYTFAADNSLYWDVRKWPGSYTKTTYSCISDVKYL